MLDSRPIRITGQLTRSIDEIDKLLAAGNANLSIDFSACTFISVEGLEWLEEILMRANSSKTNVIFVNIPPTIYKVFKVAHIDFILEAAGSPRSAVPGSAAC
jgi:anti-anti-sigma regulatory factor